VGIVDAGTLIWTDMSLGTCGAYRSGAIALLESDCQLVALHPSEEWRARSTFLLPLRQPSHAPLTLMLVRLRDFSDG